jgi:pimeloyl-ACP methyl ester carboxylesterase
VLDAAGVDRAVLVTWCDMGEGLILAAEHPERVAGMVQIGPTMTLDEPLYGDYPFEDDPGTDEGWAGDTDMATILAGFRGWETKILDPAEVGALCARVRCPVLVIHGTEDEQVPPSVGAALAAPSAAGWSCWRGRGTPSTCATRSR